MKLIIKPENKNKVVRYTNIRSNQVCANCYKTIEKGSKVIIKTVLVKRSIKREYYCLDCSEMESKI